MISVFKKFEILEDPRDERGKRYKLIDIITMVIYGLLVGLKDFTNIADMLKIKEEYFQQLLEIESTPSHDCLSDIFAVIDTKQFMQLFIEWVKEIANYKNKNISIDGKAVKSATDKINGSNVPYILSAFVGSIGLSIGEIKIDDKSNEITAIPELLDILEIKDCTITIDAIGTQEEIVNKIVKKEGHYVLKVKENQKTLQKDIKKYFENINNIEGHPEILAKRTSDKDHGRIEVRKYYLSYNTDTISDKDKWKTVNAIGYVITKKDINGEVYINKDYYILDNRVDIDKFIEIQRDHWNIECGLHWRLDVIMGEDASRNRINNSIANLSVLRKIVFNLVSLDTTLGKVPMQRKITRYMLDFKLIEELIFNNIPKLS